MPQENKNSSNTQGAGALNLFKENGIVEVKVPPGQNTGAAVITVTMGGASSSVKVIVLSCSGTLQVNYQSQQDFQGNNYITIFGRSVNDFELTCVEAKCGTKESGGSLKTVANYVKNATSKGELVTIEINYESNLSIKGVLVAVGFDFDRPVQKYTLHVIGTQQ